MNDNYKFDDSFDELLKEKYVDAMSQIKAPNELVDKTKLAIRAELATETRSILLWQAVFSGIAYTLYW